MTSASFDTERLRLRRFTAADAGHLHALDNDPEVMRYINGGAPVTLAVITADILPVFLLYDAGGGPLGFWAAEVQETGAFVGWFSLRPTGAPGVLALGYRLRRDAWGRGYATEGARALLDRAFGELDARRVVATTYEHNLASRRVMAKLGMTLARRFRYTPEELAAADTFSGDSADVWDGDDVEYAIERAAWRDRP